MSHYILDEEGNVVPEPDIFKWAKWMQDGGRTLIKTLVDQIIVSTVFLVYDHRFGDEEGLPILWETMIFGGKHDQYQERYSSKEDAIEGHNRAIKLVEEDS